MIDIEGLMFALGDADVTMILKLDHERASSGGDPWTVILSGPGVGEIDVIRTDADNLPECLNYCIGKLISSNRELGWVKDYMDP